MVKKCDYCSKETNKLRGTPYLADIGIAKNGMCKDCWDNIGTDEIGDFDEYCDKCDNNLF